MNQCLDNIVIAKLGSISRLFYLCSYTNTLPGRPGGYPDDDPLSDATACDCFRWYFDDPIEMYIIMEIIMIERKMWRCICSIGNVFNSLNSSHRKFQSHSGYPPPTHTHLK